MSRALIPFHILFDKDLSQNELRLYGLVEHMESDSKIPFFNNRTIADKLGVSHESRIVGKMLANLKEKGYIKREHKEVTLKYKNGSEKKVMRWCLSTVKQLVISSEPEDENEDQNMVPEVPPLTGVPEIPPNTMVPEVPPYNKTPSISPLTTTTDSGSGSLTPFEKESLQFKLPRDQRTTEEFLENVHHHIANNIPEEKKPFQRERMALKLLEILHDRDCVFESNGFLSRADKKKADDAKKKQEDLNLWSSYQSYVNSPVEKDLRNKGIATLMTFEIWKSKNV
jgi:hypothetical protein